MPLMQDPAKSAAAVTPSDATVLSGVRGLYVGGTGDVVVMMQEGASAVTFTAVPAGVVLPVRVRQVMAATDATGIVALY